MKPVTMNVTSTPFTLTAASGATIVPANPRRCYLAIQVTGVNPASFGFDSVPTAGGGPSLDGASVAGGQGGSWEWVSKVPIDAVYGFSTAGTTGVVLEGIDQAGN